MGTAGEKTRNRLLAAAEAIILHRGMTGLSVRKLGEEAGLNPTLVTYHFGSIGKLLEELCRRNLEVVLSGWEAVPQQEGLEAILRAWLEPMFLPAACTGEGRALVVLDEIGAHGEGEPRELVLDEMTAFVGVLRELLLPILPGFDANEMRARIRFISGAVLGPPPRNQQPPVLEDGSSVADMKYLLPFAMAALGHPDSRK